MSLCSRMGSIPSPFFFLPFFGRAALVVRWRLGSSACCPSGSLLDSMISSIVFLTEASGLSSFAFALGLAFAFVIATPKAPPCGPPDGGNICGSVDCVVIRVRFGAGAGSPLWASSVVSELVEERALAGSPLWASSVVSELVEERALVGSLV